MAVKNLCGKTREVNEPYEIWKAESTGYEYRVLKKHSGDLIWNCAVKSPSTYDSWEYGDVYVSQIKANSYQTYVDYTVASSRSTFEAIIEFFVDDKWEFEVVEGFEILKMYHAGEKGSWLCLAVSGEERQHVTFYSVLPYDAPTDRQQAVSEYITRANYDLSVKYEIGLGNFEMNFADGSIRFKTGSIDTFMTTQLMASLVYNNVAVVDAHLDALLKVIKGELSPVEAIALADVEN